MLVAAGLATVFIWFFSIDLGPHVREVAERRASEYLERPMHIGKLKALVWPGAFEIDDLVIEGLARTDQPFLTAKKIIVQVTWRTLVWRELFVEVQMTDWTMAIETWPDGRQSLPKIMPKNKSTGPKPFTTTVSFVYADRGAFTFIDHGTPWSVVARNLDFDLVRSNPLNAYVGVAHLNGGTVQIQDFLPMATRLTTRFSIDGPLVRLHQIDLVTDGARSSVQGYVDFSQWPKMHYDVKSQLDFARLRELFFAGEKWRVAGEGAFIGTFDKFKGGHELRGRFASPLTTLQTPGTPLVFPNLHGSLVWVPDRFAVTQAGADFYGGQSTFAYGLAPLGTKNPAGASFNFSYEAMDLPAFLRGVRWNDMDLRGVASGHNDMTWVNGQFGKTVTGGGAIAVTPPAGVTLAPMTLPASWPGVEVAPAPFQKDRPLGPLSVGGEVAYRLDPNGIDLSPSWAASPSTYVAFHGRADYGPNSNMPFHVTSTDWQASDRVLAAILTAAGAPTGAIEVGGFGQFDGAMTESFSQPKIEGRFAGEGLREWGVRWGRALGDIVIQNHYVTIRNGLIGDTPESTIHADGRYSLGYRTDGLDEMDGHVRVDNWPLGDFRRAFELEDWPVAGVVGMADVQLKGPYRRLFGSGALRIDRGSAWSETFDTANGDLTFNGVGLQISRIAMVKGPGLVSGSAFLKWDGTYSFDAQGQKIPVESLTSVTMPKAPLSGVLQFTASGAGEFSSPTYEFRGRIPDLSAGDQGIGVVSGVLQVRRNTLIIQQLEARSMLLQVSGSGTIALNEAYDSTLNFRFTDTSIDPYLRFMAPKLAARLPSTTRAKVSGVVQVQGELKNPAALSAFATIEQANLTLFNYDLQNDGNVLLKFENNVSTISHLRLVGDNTSLELEGEIPVADAPMRLTAKGDANLAILQGFFPDLASSGAATVNATIAGALQSPTVSGQATITDGRLRYRAFPHGLDQINGPIAFNTDHITVDEVRGRMGEGEVTFSGAITLKGLVPDQFDLRADGRSMRLRFPTGFASTVDASLTLTGPVSAPTLGGDVTVLRSSYQLEIDSDVALLALASLGAPSVGGPGLSGDSTVPLKLDLRVRAPGNALVIDTSVAKIFGSATLNFRGTIDNPSMTGEVLIERGNWFINGNRYVIQPSAITFSNASRIEPFFDIAFETKPHLNGQTYDVTIRITGPGDKLNPTFASDPFLPTNDLLLLLLGETPDVGKSELNAAQSPQQSQQQLMRTAAAQLLTMPISSRASSVVQRTTPFDTFSIVPLLGNDAVLQALNTGARVTFGKRISDRVFLTYSRILNAPLPSEVILLEYEQSDRVSWVLSRNEDRTFALDFRIRHVF